MVYRESFGVGHGFGPKMFEFVSRKGFRVEAVDVDKEYE